MTDQSHSKTFVSFMEAYKQMKESTDPDKLGEGDIVRITGGEHAGKTGKIGDRNEDIPKLDVLQVNIGYNIGVANIQRIKKSDLELVKKFKNPLAKESVTEDEDYDMPSSAQHMDRIEKFLRSYFSPRALREIDMDADMLKEEDKFYKLGNIIIRRDELGPLEPIFVKCSCDIKAGYSENDTYIFMDYDWETIDGGTNGKTVRLRSDGGGDFEFA